MKIKLAIIAIAIICIISGSYAIYQDHDNITLNDNTDTNIDKSIIPDNNNFDNQNYTDENYNANNENYQDNYLNQIFKNTNRLMEFEIYRQIPGTNLYVNKSIDYTDIYIQCICGGFIALGNTTKTLPEGAICPDACGAGVSYVDNGAHTTYEEAYALWEKNGDRQPEIINSEPTDNIDIPQDVQEDITPDNTQNIYEPNENYTISIHPYLVG